MSDRLAHLRLLAAVACPGKCGRMTKPTAYEELHKDGGVRGRVHMLDDQMHGHWEWFRLDGSLMRSGSFDLGHQIGVWTTNDRSGAPAKETHLDQ